MLPNYFSVLLNDELNLHISDVSPIENKKILSIINGFEDGKWRNTCFNEYIWDNVAFTALSKEERDKLVNRPSSMLSRSAFNLRLTDAEKDGTKGSEIAEILLYGLMTDHYKALPVVPKIFYKQNKNDYVKGADSVHIVINEEETDFSLWLGEAKFYNSIEDTRLYTIVSSVEEMLSTDKIKRENTIITSLEDIKKMNLDENLYNKIIHYLNQETSIDLIKPKLHIPILLLHECKITEHATEQNKTYEDEIKEYHIQRAKSYVKKHVAKLSTLIHKYSEINFHIILFPVPSKMEIVNNFVNKARKIKA